MPFVAICFIGLGCWWLLGIIIGASSKTGQRAFKERYAASLWADVPRPEPLNAPEPEAQKPERAKPRKRVKFEDGPSKPVLHMYQNNQTGEVLESYQDLTNLTEWEMI